MKVFKLYKMYVKYDYMYINMFVKILFVIIENLKLYIFLVIAYCLKNYVIFG